MIIAANKSFEQWIDFVSAKATIAGVELHYMLKKGQMICADNMPIWKQFYSLAA